MNTWWKKDNQQLDYVQYQVDKLTIYVGPRLNVRGCSTDFYNKIDCFISITDRFVNHRLNKLNYWFPWVESNNIPYEVIFGTLQVFNYLKNQDKELNVYLHCDAGTHRAPTVLGCFLYAYYLDQRDNIIDKAYTQHTSGYRNKETGKLFTCPKYYFESHVETFLENDFTFNNKGK